ncbi:Starch-binding associating with outer membrane [Arachidicoccus rhizosphaerae]|uniref:Starch-binding associating with outer membrane n=1 Tax=Arachidicoccus rhizosphaerae TaxID=551991 RepID=A0A1H3XZP7_9BACT|nr:RagB/SusD family nutrient uptake outer membrane protein [Arachidicoccus rhizosphaerae]SEA04836.1 Starch-binding associating with outer membrane [Arachidicoccus rhizosphaerae]
MKKLLYIFMGVLIIAGISCKKDFLNVESPSAVDEDFVFSSSGETFKVLAGMYELWRGVNNNLFYALDVPGSDAETHPEAFAAQVRHVWEGLYPSEPNIDETNFTSAWAGWYQIANRANIVMEALDQKSEYTSAIAAGTTNDWTQMYGEAAVFRAYSYFQLVRYFGDVPYFTTTIRTASQTDSARLTSRDEIYSGEIANLIKVLPNMYRLGAGGITAERFSRTFAEGLIGKMALFAGGYSLRRTDFDYGAATFTQIGTEKWNAKYVRLTNYKDYYQIAKTYLQAVVDNPGSAYLITTDTRGAGYDNPFQLNFQYNMNLEVSPESLYEIGETQGQFSERPYAFGRPSGGGSSNAYPCKSYGQSRIYPAFYYGEYDPKDKRRDVTVGVTANSGSCSEKLVDFTPGSRNLGGLFNNKWDDSRMANPYTASQRQSGINWPQMRMSDVILMLAEVDAELGDEGAAKTELTKVRSRAFDQQDQATKVTAYIGTLSGDALKDAIYEERKLELAGEGLLRYDLIREGRLPAAIKSIRDRETAMVSGLTTNGYYTFANGNQIANYIWVKAVNVADLGMSKMLTTQCEVDSTDPTYPVRFPGWRGNCDLWTSSGFTDASGNRNLAIEGLFHYIAPGSAEATALEASGYVKTAWGINIVNNASQYSSDIFKGYPDAYLAAGVPPRYLLPLSTETISQSNGLISNGYGFEQ